MSGVTSKETSSPPSTGRTTRKNAPLEPGGFSGFSIGAFGLVVSAIFWIIGARWTIDGLIVMFNGILQFLNVTYVAPIPPPFLIYAILSPVPVIFSAVEWQTPWEGRDGEVYFAKPGAWLVWFIAGGFDAYTTYLGLGVDPGPEAVTIMRQIALSGLPRITVAIILTMGPEWLGREMIALMKRIFFGKK